MTILAVLGELNLFMEDSTAVNVAGVDYRMRTDGTFYDANYSRKATDMTSSTHPYDDGSDHGVLPLIQPKVNRGQLWMHMYLLFSNSYEWKWPCQLKDASGKPVIGFGCDSYDLEVYSYNDSGTAIMAGVTHEARANPARAFNLDICFDFDNNEVRLYDEGNRIATVALDLNRRTAGTEMTYVGFRLYAANDCHFSEFLIADTQTIGFRVKTLAPEGAGDAQEWSGTVDDINDAGMTLSEYNRTNVPAKQLYTYTDIQAEIQEEMVVDSIQLSTIAQAIGTVKNLSNVVKVDGEEFVTSTTDVQFNECRNPVITEMKVNPKTGKPWTFDEINAIQMGFKVES
ncbi:hypothetical protein HOU76_gp16 [Vibrio phage 1.169.O._10N.261.52.B1]|uniref:Uncharacterized protein n=1 Tax=Vibrio phage 1.169.O._10N.261.52.B1 TaxID=1881213 RepID=A0A2I7RES3_9CAUD|nr:hypothetical protein HOU76_gp16 [Vibrio phage 1.169.O._10N.261.52.B1]AUR92111.1 hypothetical protein NVP1169O_83 [Vibrio phage 1.169.O._10N.261.52.B1]